MKLKEKNLPQLLKSIEKDKTYLIQRKNKKPSLLKHLALAKTNVKYHRHNELKDNHKSFIIEGHRGVGMFEAHNSISSFQKAIDMRLDYVELDTWLSIDGIVVVVHGTENKVETTGGQQSLIESLTSQELLSISINNKGDTIPTLHQVLTLCKGKIKVNIELKGNNHQLPLSVLKVVQECQMENEVYLSAFYHPFFSLFQSAKAELNITQPIIFGFLFAKKEQFPKLEDIPSGNQLNFSSLMAFDPDAIELMCSARNKGITLCAYFGFDLLENEGIYSRLLNIGVKSIITNQPSTLLNFRNKYFPEGS